MHVLVASSPVYRDNTMKKVIRIGILGCSDIAARKVIPALKGCKNALLTGISSRSSKKAECWSKDLGVKAYTYEGLLYSKDIDMVYISLPNSFHKEWGIKAVENGKHVLCEKPLAIDLASTEEMVEAARRNKKYLFESFMYLHHPQHSEVKRISKKGTIGKPVIFRSSFGFSFQDTNNFRLKKELGGGAFLDIAGYPISAMRFFFDCEPIRCAGFQKINDAKLNISGTLSILMENGVIGQISYGFNQSYECFYKIVGTSGSIFLDRCYTTPETLESTILIKAGNDEKTININKANHFTLMIDDFCRKIIDLESREDIYSDLVRQARAMELIRKGLFDIACF